MRNTRESVLQKTTQTEKAYAAMKRAILCGELGEGVFLSEAQVMKQYGIGRTPYREACNRLHREGLLEVVPRRGYLVPELSFHAVRDLFEVRLILEGTIAELAAVRATRAEIEELERIAARFAHRKSLPDFAETIGSNTEFHLCMARMTQNQELVRMLTAVLEHTQRLSYLELRSSRVQQKQAQMLHAPIVSAIRKRDPSAARAAVLDDIVQAQSITLGHSAWNCQQDCNHP